MPPTMKDEGELDYGTLLKGRRLFTPASLAAMVLIALVSWTMAETRPIGRITTETAIFDSHHGRQFKIPLPVGTPVEILSVSGDLVMVKTPAGVTGNIYTDKVSGIPTSMLPPAGKVRLPIFRSIAGQLNLTGMTIEAGTNPRTITLLVTNGRKASVGEIIEAAKANAELAQPAIAIGELNKKAQLEKHGLKYESSTDVLKRIPAPVAQKATFSLRPEIEKLGMRPKKQVRKLDSCSLFASAAGLEYLYKKAGINFEPSIAFLNWTLDSESGEVRRSPGTSPELLLESLPKYGVCSEKEFPRERIGATPGPEVKASALNHTQIVAHGIHLHLPSAGWAEEYRIAQYSRGALELEVQMVMNELKSGHPVLASLHIPDVRHGDLKYEDKKKDKGPHEVLIIGFTTEDGTAATTRYEFLNSWGAEWGNGGYGTIPADWGFGMIWSISLN